MTKKNIETQKVKLSKLEEIIKKYGKDKEVTDTKGTAAWLKDGGYPSLADLISHDSKN